MNPDCVTCGYTVEWVRSCYRSEWSLPELPGVRVKGRYYFNDSAPAYPGWHNFGSRNWTTAEFEKDAPFGERGDTKQRWDNGSFPVRKPDPVIVGTPECIEAGTGGQPLQELRWAWYFGQPGWVGRYFSGVQYFPPAILQQGLLATRVFASAGPFQSQTAAQAYLNSMPTVGFVDPITLLNYTGQVPSDGWWVVRIILAAWGPAVTRYCHGVNLRCWVEGGIYCFAGTGGLAFGGTGYPPSPFNPAGGFKQAGAADFGQGSEWAASGGFKQQGAADFSQESAWSASGGFKQQGGAVFSQESAWSASGGFKQQGGAVFAQGSSWSGSGGFKQQGVASITQGATWSGSGGFKQAGAAIVSAKSKYFTQSTNTVTTCDTVGADNYDLGVSSGSGTSEWTVSGSTFTERMTFDIAWTPHDGPISVSLNVTSLTSTRVPTCRFRVQALNSLCAVLANSAYSAEFNTTGVKTLTDSISGTSGANRLRISLEAKRTSGPVIGNNLITNGASSWVEVSL